MGPWINSTLLRPASASSKSQRSDSCSIFSSLCLSSLQEGERIRDRLDSVEAELAEFYDSKEASELSAMQLVVDEKSGTIRRLEEELELSRVEQARLEALSLAWVCPPFSLVISPRQPFPRAKTKRPPLLPSWMPL